MKGNLLLGGMSLTGPENPPEVGHHLWAARKAMERGMQSAACGPPCWGWCFGGTRSGKPQMRTEQKLGPCCLPWCPELGHSRRCGTWAGALCSNAHGGCGALPGCSCPGSFSGVQGSASMLGCCPAQGIPGRAGGAQGTFPPAPCSLHDIC